MAAFLLPQVHSSTVCKVLGRLNQLTPRSSALLHVMHSLPVGSSRYNGSVPGHRGPLCSTTGTVSVSTAPGEQALPEKPAKMRSLFCRMCGQPMQWGMPAGEHEWRHVCNSCGYVDYYNPKMVVGCIVEHEGKILMCRRGIEPCRGLWTLPAGYMELNESSADGASRETWEEANARVEVLGPYVHFDIPRIGQAYILFRARLVEPYSFSPGEETLETVLMRPQDIPMAEVAFSSISVALQLYQQDLQRGQFHIHHGVIDKRKGSAPNAPDGFSLEDHFAIATTVPTAQTVSSL